MKIINKKLEYIIYEVFERIDNIVHVKDIDIYEPYYLDSISNEIYSNKLDNSDIYLTKNDLIYLKDYIYLPIDGYLSKKEIIKKTNINKLIEKINKRRFNRGIPIFGFNCVYNKEEYKTLMKNKHKHFKNIFNLVCNNLDKEEINYNIIND